LPELLLQMIPPRPPENPTGRENFYRRTSPALMRWLPRKQRRNRDDLRFSQTRPAHDRVSRTRCRHPGFDELATSLLAAT